MKDLNDPSKTCIYIPPGLDGEDSDASSVEEDLGDEVGYELRMEAYRVAWAKCLDRVRNILKALYAPIVDEVASQVARAYTDVLPGLPYPELPVVALYGADSTLLADIIHKLDERGEDSAHHDGDTEDGSSVLHVHMYPAECNNVANTMKTLITGFVDRRGPSKRRPTSLASFDINLLQSWYNAQDPSPRLTVFLHDFEKFDGAVMQDVLYICSLHVPNLPLVFVPVMTSPPSPSFIHSAYPRSTLSLLRVHQVVAPTGLTTVKEVLSQTFFDPDFEPDLMLGPGALDYISDFAFRHTSSPDALLTMLQLVHMKHFSQPLTVFVHNELLGKPSLRDAERLMSSDDFHSILDEFHARILTPLDSATPGAVARRPQNTRELFGYVSNARSEFRQRLQRIRIAFAVARTAERVALGEAHGHTKSADNRGARIDSLDTLSALLRGRAESQVHYVCLAVKKLSAAKLRELLGKLYSFWNNLKNVSLRVEEADARLWVVDILNRLPEEPERLDQYPDLPEQDTQLQDANTKALAREAGEWLEAYVAERVARLEDRTLWDIWYTGGAPFPSELINPAPRPTIVSALLHPHDFVQAYASLARTYGHNQSDIAVFGGQEGDRERELWELPDTSIAFRRYVEAGRMVNVFDWFESFAVVLESQRRNLRKRALRVNTSPVKVNGRGTKGKGSKGKGRVTPATTDGEDDDADMDLDEVVDEEEEERWKVEVQARFMRALHELDYMGFVRHTGRKADHVIRTIYDVPD